MSGADEGVKAVAAGISNAFEKLVGPTEALFNSILISLFAVSTYLLYAIWDLGYTADDLEHLRTVWEVFAVKAGIWGSFVFLICIMYQKFNLGEMTLEEE